MNRKHSNRNSRRYYRKKKSWTAKCKDYSRQFIAFLFSNVGIICLVIGYTIAGALFFVVIEQPRSLDNTNSTVRLKRARENTTNVLWSKVTNSILNPLNKTQFQREVIEQLQWLQRHIVTEVQDWDYDGHQSLLDRWTIAASSLYCLTVITTIGYGNIAPRTPWGKAATVVYAIFGMPLFLLYLSNIGDLFAKSFKWLYAKICLCKMCRTRRKVTERIAVVDSNSWRNTPEESWQRRISSGTVGEVTEGEESDDEETESSVTETSSSSPSSGCVDDLQDITVPISLCLAIMIGYISSGAILIGHWEELDFRDGSYFCFISLSTIGFGDIVPTTKTTADRSKIIGGIVEMKFIFCSIYLMLGMALIAMCFNLMQQEVVHKIRTCTDIIRHLARCNRNTEVE